MHFLVVNKENDRVFRIENINPKDFGNYSINDYYIMPYNNIFGIMPDMHNDFDIAGTQITNAMKWQSVRDWRDRLLLDSDWTQLSDSPLTSSKKEEWKVYRHLLRDVPETYDIPDNVVWPTIPSD
jgi:hypothetical protein